MAGALADLSPFQAHALYALAWLGFGAGHSILAAGPVKRALAPLFGPHYRLAYNLFAAVHFAAVWAFGVLVLRDMPTVGVTEAVARGLVALRVLGVVVLLVALREYDLGRFSGLAQMRAARGGQAIADDEPLRTGGLHRFVRHPVYLGAYLILWGGATTAFGLATAVWGTLYLIVGTRFEERKLIDLHGEAYREYRARVPEAIPWRGRAWPSRRA